jgi:hypothetical protein
MRDKEGGDPPKSTPAQLHKCTSEVEPLATRFKVLSREGYLAFVPCTCRPEPALTASMAHLALRQHQRLGSWVKPMTYLALADGKLPELLKSSESVSHHPH